MEFLVLFILVLFILVLFILVIVFAVVSIELIDNYYGDTVLELKCIGLYTTRRGVTHDLVDYCVDKDNNLYSFNPRTWEIDSRRKFDVLKCSDSSLDSKGFIVNSLRDTLGRKITLRRSTISFDRIDAPVISMKIKKLTDRNISIVRMI